MVLFNDGNPKEALAQFMGEHETIILNNSSMCIYVWGERENQQHLGGAGRFNGAANGDEVLSSKRRLLHYICDCILTMSTCVQGASTIINDSITFSPAQIVGIYAAWIVKTFSIVLIVRLLYVIIVWIVQTTLFYIAMANLTLTKNPTVLIVG